MRIAVAATAFLLIHRLIKKKKQQSKQFRVKKLYANRLQYGNRLFNYLAFDDEVQNFARMSREEFDILYGLVKTKIRKNDTNFRKAITVKETYFFCFNQIFIVKNYLDILKLI